MIDATRDTHDRLAEARADAAEAELQALGHYTQSLRESLELWDKVVSFEREELFDDEGREIWSRIGLQDWTTGATALAFRDEAEHTRIRNQCRHLALHSEFAINGHENRINYIVGEGHQYKVEAAPGAAPADDLIDAVRTWLHEWIDANHWHKRQQEIVRRRDRDGEAFLRFFPQPGGMLLLRFIEPEHVKTPDERAGDEDVRFGIQFEPDDAETPLVYFVNGKPVLADQIQHRKANVDLAVPRGLPLFYSVRKNLRRVETILRNTGTTVEMRAVIAWAVEHATGSAAKVQEFLANQADVQVTNRAGAMDNYKRYRPGTILHHGEGQKYTFPEMPDPAGVIAYIQAELRAVASRLVMPEFMLSSDASNANYSSTMVAEGPAVKMFQRQQRDMITDDEQVISRALKHAISQGMLPQEAEEAVRIVAEPPSVITRNELQEVQADSLLHRDRILSKQSYAARHDLDYETEQENFDEEDDREDTLPAFGVNPFAQGQQPEEGVTDAGA